MTTGAAVADVVSENSAVAVDAGPQLAPTSLSLRRNFSWTLAGNLVYAACQWGVLIVLAKLATPEMVGRFALGLAVTTPIVLLCNLSLRAIQATDARGEHELGHYLALRLVTTGVAGAAIGAMVWLAGYSRETAGVVLLVGVAKCIESVSDVLHGAMQRVERMHLIAISMMVKGAVSLCAVGVVVYSTRNVLWGAVALCGGAVVSLAAVDVPGVARLAAVGRGVVRPVWDFARVGGMALGALPLSVALMFVALSANIPRYFIAQHHGERELGIFSAVAYLMVIGSQLVQAMGQSAIPRLARLFAEGDRRGFAELLWKLTGVAVALGAVGVAVVLAAGAWVLTVLYSGEYAGARGEFLLLMGAAGAAYVASVLGYGITATRKFGRFVLPYAAVAALTLAASALLIPRGGLRGAAWATVVSNVAGILAAVFVLASVKQSGQAKITERGVQELG